MSTATTYTCDACGTTTNSAADWISPYFPHNGGTRDVCPRCATRWLAQLENRSAAKALEDAVAEATAPLHARIKELETSLELHKATATRECRQADRWKHEWGDALAKLNATEADRITRCNHVDRIEHELAVASRQALERRGLVNELLKMLGKKARKRHMARIAFITKRAADET